MPRGGKRAGAGRKPKPLAEKIADGNPGHRPLKKLDWGGNSQLVPPEYLKLIEKPSARIPQGIPTPTSIFKRVVKQLEPSGCVELVGAELIAEYAVAKYFLLSAQYELSQTTTVGRNDDGVVVVTSYADAMLRMQKNVVMVWGQIWDIVTRNSETVMKNPENDVFMTLLAGRARKKRKIAGDEEVDDFGGDGHT